MSDILTANPKLDAFVIEGGWPLFGAPQPYRQLTDQYKKQIADKSLAKEGRVEALVGQRPFEMGYKAPTVMISLIKGEKVDDPVFTGLDECTKATADTCIQR
jgi:ribose transport system substrate-binding protein